MDGIEASTGKVAAGQALRQRAPPAECPVLAPPVLAPPVLALTVPGPGARARTATPSHVALLAARGAGRLLRAAVILLGALAMAALAGVLVVAWQARQGPLDLDWLVQRLVAAHDAAQPGAQAAVGHAELEWHGFTAGPDSAVTLRLASVRLDDAVGQPIVQVGAAAATLSLSGLLHGEVAPDTLRLERVAVQLVRDGEGIKLDGPPRAPPSGAPAARLAQVLTGLAQPPSGQAKVPGLRGLERLRDIQVEGLDVTLHDQVLGTVAHLVLGSVAAQREAAGGLRGTAAGTLTVAGVAAHLSLDADLAPGGGTRLHFAMDPVALDGLHGIAPALDGLRAVQMPIGGNATLLLSPALLPTAATLHLDAGPGALCTSATS